MNYKSLVHEFTNAGYMKKLAGDMKNKMIQLRQHANPNDDRRWIWELIQNGKDVRYAEVPFHVEINLVKNENDSLLEFKHNGKPFSVKNITYLVEQVSSKDQEYEENGQPSNTGKFGSGFLTTHLLSEIVEIETVIKAEQLEYKKCTIELDRSMRDEAGIIQSIQKSLSVLEDLDEFDDYPNFNPADYNTIFKYRLDNNGIQIAERGLSDLDSAIAYTLVFVPSITEVNIAHDFTSYKILHELTSHSGDINFYTIEKLNIFDVERYEIATIKGKKVEIALPIERVDDQVILKAIPDQIPKLFCDFPLVGTEDFPFAVIINSSFFNLNDPRSIVRLTDINEPDIIENKALIEEAVELFQKMLAFCNQENVHNAFNISYLPHTTEKEWISNKWYNEFISSPIFASLSSSKIIETEKGERRTVIKPDGQPYVLFPSAATPEIRNEIFLLANQWFPQALPKKDDIHFWYEVLWPKCTKLTLKKFTEYISQTGNIKTLQEKLTTDTDVIVWLNSYYDLLNREENFIKDITANEIGVLPDQNGNFKLMKELMFGSGIPEIIKDVLYTLGYDIRAELRDDDIKTVSKYNDKPRHPIEHHEKKLSDVYSKLNDFMKGAPYQQTFEAATKISQVFFEDGTPEIREALFQAVIDIHSHLNLKKVQVSIKYNASIFFETDKVLLNSLLHSISENNNLDAFASRYTDSNIVKAKKWLAKFVEMLIEMKQPDRLNDKDTPILINENGNFRVKEALSSGSNTDETLKDVASKLGYDFREYLVDIEMPIEFANSEITNTEIAEKIMFLAGNLMADMHGDSEVQEAFQMLFNWFNRNQKESSELFGDFYNNRHRLCSSEIIIDSMDKASKYDDILKEFNLDDEEQLRERLLQYGQQDSSTSVLTPVTRDILVSLGVRNYEEFKLALQDKNLAELFGHESVPSHEWFLFAEAKTDRAIKRVRQFLEDLGYDFSNADNIATTVFSGVKKIDKIIDVVCRASDNSEVIFYWGSEKQTLQNHDAELWIDNGVGNPRQLTLGKILIDNDINKVKVKL